MLGGEFVFGRNSTAEPQSAQKEHFPTDSRSGFAPSHGDVASAHEFG